MTEKKIQPVVKGDSLTSVPKHTVQKSRKIYTKYVAPAARSAAKIPRHPIVPAIAGVCLILFSFIGACLYLYEKHYENKAYPSVWIDGKSFGGVSRPEIIKHWNAKSAPFENKQFELVFEDHIATVSAAELGVGFDSELIAAQAMAVGRSGYFFSDIQAKFSPKKINLTPYFRWKTDVLDDRLNTMSDLVNIPPEDALFDFRDGKVTAFKLSKDGRKLDKYKATKEFQDIITSLPQQSGSTIRFPVPIEIARPTVSTDKLNTFGVKELISTGYSKFSGSIPGRIHNVEKAASIFHGHLIKPGEEFSYNDIIGDISVATGYLQAYVIKDGKTVLGDGGGVCQVSSTLFRAALNAGLPITERRAHAYRVHYYEDGGFKPGLDATVYAPSVDFRFKNDTPASILIQTKINKDTDELTIDFYGSKDGRKAEILNHKVWDVVGAPAPRYDDDPTLPVGVVKQVDFAAGGAKASFQYKVTNADGTTRIDETYFSNFRPWQAVFLKGTKT